MSTTSAWRPQEAPLRQLISYLVDSLSGLDRNVQRNAEMVSRPTWKRRDPAEAD